jgi:anti-sigma regulatory factor (Ser/Thr protein kinase)
MTVRDAGGTAGLGDLLLESEDVAWFFDDPSAARGAASALARRIGLTEQRGAEIALAVTEAGTNLTKHAVNGAIVLRVVRTERDAGLEFLTIDSGPGIADVPAALRDGSSTSGTLGIGLGAVARLADMFDLHSIPGRGTVLAARFWPRGPAGAGDARAEPAVAGLTRAISGERVCGDAWAARLDGGPGSGGSRSSGQATGGQTAAQAVTDHQPAGPDWAMLTATRTLGASPATVRSNASSGSRSSSGVRGPALLVMLCDGLGHGPLAALASQAAVLAFRDGPGGSPQEVLSRIHLALRGTRGAAIAVARIEPAERRLLFCGIGNIAATLLSADSRSGLLSFPGIVGHQMRGMRTFEAALPPGGALVMHSDGLTERWTTAGLPGLFEHPPIVMAAQLLREAGVRRDDASVVVAKGAW